MIGKSLLLLRRFIPCGGILLLIVLSVAQRAEAGNCPGTDPTDYIDDTENLQKCLDNMPVVYLDPGSPGYLISDVLRFRRDGLVLTSSVNGTQATIQALPYSKGPMLRLQCDTPGCSDPINWDVSWIVFDGNRVNRAYGCHDTFPDGSRVDGANMKARGSGYQIRHNRFINALCGTGLEVVGNNYEIYDNDFAWNGFSVDERPNSFADGMTLNRCEYGYVHNNYFENNTDVNLVIAPDVGCRVAWNHVTQDARYGFVGIQVGPPGFYGSGGEQFQNIVSSGYNLLTFGYFIGKHAWGDSTEWANNVGDIYQNESGGAVVNFAVDGILGGSIHDNYGHDAQGSRHFESGCTASANYTSGDYGSASVVGPFIGMVFHTWGASPPGCY